MTGLRAGVPFRVHGHLVVPVVRVYLESDLGNGGAWAVGGRTPVAVAVRDGRGTRAVNMHGEDVPLADLLHEADGLAAALGNDDEGGKT